MVIALSPNGGRGRKLPIYAPLLLEVVHDVHYAPGHLLFEHCLFLAGAHGTDMLTGHLQLG